MKKKLFGLIMIMVFAFVLLSGCSTENGSTGNETEESTEETEAAAPKTPIKSVALVTKFSGNAFMELLADGVKEVVEKSGGSFVAKHPAEPTAEAQAAEVNSLIDWGVNAIIISANDKSALSEVLTKAKGAGIKIITTDSDTAPEDRLVFVNQADTEQIGKTLMAAACDIAGGSGQYAILSSTFQAANQNAWIDVMKQENETNPDYAEMKLTEVAYGDDDPQKSADQTKALLEKYPELKVIVAPTTVGIAAAAKVLQESGSAVKLTGLGLPSAMQEYMGGCCPYMYLWNMTELGNLAGYTAMALLNGEITGAAGETFTAGDLGEFTIVDEAAPQIVLGPPYRFDSTNCGEWVSKGM